MLTFSCGLLVFLQTQRLRKNLNLKLNFKKKNNDSNYSHFQTVDEVEESEFIIIESEPQFEVESNWF